MKLRLPQRVLDQVIYQRAAVGDAYVLASETCAFDLIEAEHLRDLEPGEMLVIEDGRMTTLPCIEPAARQSACIFELIYFARPDSLVFGHDTYSTRKTMGQILAQIWKI